MPLQDRKLLGWRANVAAAAAGAGQRTQRTLFSHGFSVSASSRTGIASTHGAGPPPPRDDGGGGTGSVVAGRDERDDGSSSEEEEARSEEEEEEEGELETAVTQLEERAARRKRQRKNREASWRSLFENECSCRGDNEDDDEEDDDDGGSLSDDFLVDDDLADTNDDERQDVTFWARVTREMDRRAGEKEEEPPDEEEDPDDDPTEAETMAVPMTPQASKKNARAVPVEHVGDMFSPESGTALQDAFKYQIGSSGGFFVEGVSKRTGRVHARAIFTGDKAKDEQSRLAANAKRKNKPSNLYATADRKEGRLRKKKKQMESSGSAEKKEEAKKEQRTLETVATGTRGGGGIR